MRVRRATAIILVAAALAAGCTAPSQTGTARRGGVSVRVAAAERGVRCAQWRPQHAAPLPAGLVAAAAVRCVETFITVHGQGREVWIEQQADRGLAPLVAAVREPSARPTPGTLCAGRYVSPVALLLIDRRGHIAQPVIPTDVCGGPLDQVLAAVQRVPWVTVHAPSPAR